MSMFMLLLVLCISCVVSQPTACSQEEEDGEECRQITGEDRLMAMLERLHDKLERLEQKVDDGMKTSGEQLTTLQQKVDDGMMTSREQLMIFNQKVDKRFEILGKQINLALGKSAFQSSVYYSDVVQSGPGNAVDGNMNPHRTLNSCSTTNNEPNPWWAVDLGESYNVTRVVVTNRDGAEYSRLQSVSIGVTNTSPLDTTPALTNYRRCVHLLTAVPEAATLSMPCLSGPMRGRYVIVQLDQNPQILTLCEVQVFADFGGDL